MNEAMHDMLTYVLTILGALAMAGVCTLFSAAATTMRKAEVFLRLRLVCVVIALGLLAGAALQALALYVGG